MIHSFRCEAPIAIDDAGNTEPCGSERFRFIRDSTGRTFLRCDTCMEDHDLSTALAVLSAEPALGEAPR